MEDQQVVPEIRISYECTESKELPSWAKEIKNQHAVPEIREPEPSSQVTQTGDRRTIPEVSDSDNEVFSHAKGTGDQQMVLEIRDPHKCTEVSSEPPSLPLASLHKTALPPHQTIYESLKSDLENNPTVREEVGLGKRVGFYKLRGQVGAGNFSKVKLGIHLLTKGELVILCCIVMLYLKAGIIGGYLICH